MPFSFRSRTRCWPRASLRKDDQVPWAGIRARAAARPFPRTAVALGPQGQADTPARRANQRLRASLPRPALYHGAGVLLFRQNSPIAKLSPTSGMSQPFRQLAESSRGPEGPDEPIQIPLNRVYRLAFRQGLWRAPARARKGCVGRGQRGERSLLRLARLRLRSRFV